MDRRVSMDNIGSEQKSLDKTVKIEPVVNIKNEQGPVFLGDKYDDNNKLLQKSASINNDTSNLNESLNNKLNRDNSYKNNSNKLNISNEHANLEGENNSFNKNKSFKEKEVSNKSVHNDEEEDAYNFENKDRILNEDNKGNDNENEMENNIIEDRNTKNVVNTEGEN